MALRYYDEAVALKLTKWIPENSDLRVLKPDETKRLFETMADDSGDMPVKLPFIALSRNTDIEILATTKQNKSFRGVVLGQSNDVSVSLNVIPVKVEYKLDIYAKKYEDADEYLRTFLFKLINNPRICIGIPYQNEALNVELQHVANIRVSSNVADTSDISEHLFAGQFTRWTIQFELQDAFLFSVPYRNNWKLDITELALEITPSLEVKGEEETIYVPNTVARDIKYNWSKIGVRRYCTATCVAEDQIVTEKAEAIYIVDQVATASRPEKGHFVANFNNKLFSAQILNLV